MRYKFFYDVRSKMANGRYFSYVAMLVFSLLTTLVISGPTATASATFSGYPITSGYRNISTVTTAGGSLWYREVDPAAPDPYTYYDIGNLTTSGTVTNYNLRTLSGNSSLTIASLTTGSDGNVWFSGTNGGSALAGVLNISTGTVTLYPYNAVPVYNTGPGQIVSGSDGDLYYLAKSANDSYTYIIYVNPTTGATGTIGNSGYPGYFTSIAASSDGFLWVTEPQNRNILAFHIVGGSGGYHYIIPGTTYPGSVPDNIVVGPDGNIWFTDNDNSSSSTFYIYKLTRSSGTFTQYASQAGQLTAGPDGAVWFLDTSSLNKIGRISSAGVITEYTLPSGGTKGGLTVGPDDAMWFTYSDSGGRKVGRLMVTPDFSSYPTTSSYATPGSVTTASGSLWYIEGTTSAPKDYIGNMTTSGAVTDYNISVPTGETTFTINNITTGPDGNVWFDGCANTTGSVYVGSLSVSTGAVTFYKNTNTKGGSMVSCWHSNGPGSIVAGSDGYVWYADENYEASGNNEYIFSVNPSTGITSTGYNVGPSPFSLTFGPDGRLWYVIPANNSFYATTVSAGAITGTGSVVHVPTNWSNQTDLTPGPDGNVWFLETGKIGKVTPGGVATDYMLASGVYPAMLAPGSDGAMWFVDNGSGTTRKIGRISGSGAVTEYTIPGTSLGYVNGLTLGSDGAMWFTYSDSGGRKVGRLGY